MSERDIMSIVISSWCIIGIFAVIFFGILSEIRDELSNLHEQLIQLGMDILGVKGL